MVRHQAWTYKGRLICIDHRRVHVRMADAMEIVFDDDLMETGFNEILLDYLEMQGRSSSDEYASDEDDSSSGNDSDIGHAISADIVGMRGSNDRRRSLHPPCRLPLLLTGFEINAHPLARGDWKPRGMSRIFAQVVRRASGYFNLFCQLCVTMNETNY